MITDLTKLTKNDIAALLNKQGYSDDGIYSAEYQSATNGQLKYKIKYNDDGIMGLGYVFVFIDNNGQLSCDY